LENDVMTLQLSCNVAAVLYCRLGAPAAA